jgi:hypothetical protein
MNLILKLRADPQVTRDKELKKRKEQCRGNKCREQELPWIRL